MNAEEKLNITKRIRCKSGTRWVESAQKCMTSSEKDLFMFEKRQNKTKKLKPLPLVAKEPSPSPLPLVEKEPSPSPSPSPLVAKESIFSKFISIFSKPNNAETESIDEKKEIPTNLPENVLLNEKQKKCPPNYIRHPAKSRNCKLIKASKETEKKRKTRKNTIIPQIQIQPQNDNIEESIGEDISIHQSKLSDDSPLFIEKEEEEEEGKEEEEEEKEEEEGENKKRIQKETIPNSEKYEELDPENAFLYPDLSDPNFSKKIYNKKEFNDYQYDGTIYDVESQARKECNAPFEIIPHQQFVKNFLSMETPYNSLLLYHELGTGKTCSAIGITEEMRKYMKQTGNVKKILIVASPNVQDNFKLQLFDEYKLQEIGRQGSGMWNLNSCVGNDLLKEINPNNDIMTKVYIIKKIQTLIRESYDFIGYESLANYINNVASISGLSADEGEHYNNQVDEKKIRKIFDNRMIVIDEVHNIIGKEDSESKLSSKMLLKLVKYCKQLRLLFLSATPMYNTHREIIWLINIMNMNDQRSIIHVHQVFNEDGSFVEEIKDEDGTITQESGKDILKRKLIGYISYIRGENPYIFPYRIYPSEFASIENQILKKTYPKKQMNGKIIEHPLKYVQVYANTLGEYQQKGYSLIIQNSFKTIPDFEEKETFGYLVLQEPISALNMIYPNENLDDELLTEDTEEVIGGGARKKNETNIGNIISEIQGKQGFNNVITYKTKDYPEPLAYDFEYKPHILKKYGRIFSKEHISKYSGKIANICNIIQNSKGIVLIYSKYIEGGLIPMALALEEMGFSRYGEASYTKSLFKTKPVPDINPLTMKPDTPENNTGYIARYVMITGQKNYSPNNNADLKLVTDISNKNGEHVRVVLISEAGSEGLDFKNIRQVHILDPWYNMNRIEQVLGRAVRTKSHCNLPLKDRNVEIYLHGSYLNAEEEMVDMYMYRLAEKKALFIGQVTRVLKETAVDCLLNIDQTNFTEEKMAQTISLELSTNNKQIEYSVGDKPFTNMCDYMENCTFTCSGTGTGSGSGSGSKPDENVENPLPSETYSQYFLQNNYSRIAKRIRQIFREKSVYSFDIFVKEINIVKPFPLEQIYYTISIFLNNKEWLMDKKGKKGYLIKRKNTYLFQPLEIKNENASIFERTSFVENKRKYIPIEIPKDPIISIKPTPINASLQTNNKNQWIILQKTMEIIFSQTSYIKPILQNMHWYHYAKLAFRICVYKHNLPENICKKYIVYHYLDLLPSIEDKLWFLNDITKTKSNKSKSRNNTTYNEYIDIVDDYFQEKMNETKNYILLNDKIENKMFIKENDTWKPAKISSSHENWLNSFDLKEKILEHMNIILSKSDKPPELHIGFMSIFKENMDFKIKNLLNTRQNVGASCYQTNKQKLIDKLNDLLKIMKGLETKETYSSDPVFSTSSIERPNLCIVYEILLRYFTDSSENKKEIWFLNPEQSVATKIDSFVAISQTIRGETRYILKVK